jgi:peptidoglycan L-alanyl-D-glutamate endopeptidase CwlK
MRPWRAIEKTRLESCHVELQKIVEAARDKCLFFVVCGHRNQADQERAFREGKTKLQWPHSKHNGSPSLAIDLAPCNEAGKINWDDIGAFKTLAFHMLAEASRQGVRLRWGGDWNMNGKTSDEKFVDMPHFELVEP